MSGPVVRKTLLLFHLIASIGLMGAVAAFVVLAIVGFYGDQPFQVRAAYWAARVITWSLVLPFSLAALISGLVVSLSTPWGLFRHYWVVFKLILTSLITAVLAVHTYPVDFVAEIATRDDPIIHDLISERRQLVMASTAGLAAIFVVSVISVFKPRGLTRYGWRKQQDSVDKTGVPRDL